MGPHLGYYEYHCHFAVSRRVEHDKPAPPKGEKGTTGARNDQKVTVVAPLTSGMTSSETSLR